MNNKDYARVSTATILQMDNAECGSASLGIILSYFKCYISPSELRLACDVSRDGSKAINIVKAARQYGLEAHVMQLNLENIRLLPPPYVIYWQFNHFLVVEGFEKNKVYINDPATGPRSVSLEEFSKSFTGIVIYLAPGENFKTEGKPEKPLNSILREHIQGAWGYLFYMIMASLTLFFPQLSLAFFVKIFMDNMIIQAQWQWISPLLIAILFTMVVMVVLRLLKEKYIVLLRLKLKTNTVFPFFRHLLHLPVDFFQQRATGDIAERIEAYQRVTNLLIDQIVNNFLNLCLLLFCWGALFLLDMPIAVVVIALSILNFFVTWIIANRHVDHGAQYAQAEGKLAGVEINALQVIETIQANALDDYFFNYWSANYAQKINKKMCIESQNTVLNFIPILMQSLSLILIIAFAGWQVFDGLISFGSFFAIIILAFNFNAPIRAIISLKANIFKVKGDIGRINDVMNYPVENTLKSNTDLIEISAKENVNALEFKEVRFGYSKLEPPILENISFSMKSGERVALVGPTGGGKSSLIKLICGLYAPWEGEINLLGSNLQNISRSILAKWVGVVEQHIFLFSASIRDNLTLWNPSVSDSSINQALNLVGLSETVVERGGLEAWVEERGKNFSGGQVQRFEIARALLHKPVMLILDEATSALDPVSEEIIYHNLKKENITLFIIAHRISAIRDCDQILVMDNGKIIESGTHDELFKYSGLYKELVDLEIQ